MSLMSGFLFTSLINGTLASKQLASLVPLETCRAHEWELSDIVHLQN